MIPLAYGGDMRKSWVVLAEVGVLACPLTVEADCDQKEAQALIKEVVNGGLATREDSGITIWYTWKAGWYSMSKDKQYSIASGLGGVERCLRSGVTVRIRAAGKDVARSRESGTELIER